MLPTPIADFIDNYIASGAARFHMPGHKGRLLPECAYDITEFDGAGDLFAEDGIVADSEAVASSLFGCRTFYSTEGSSLAIRAMLALATGSGNKTVLAGRNAHRAYLSAAILLGLETEWLCPAENASYLSCPLTAQQVQRALDRRAEPPAAVYLTSPDYLGHTLDVAAIAAVCHQKGVPLLVDNAHGAYLKFLPASRHPIDLGADLCADSAHKTLPALTGGAYLHLSDDAARRWAGEVKETMALFATASPSYLLLRSLDLTNRYLAIYPEKLRAFLCTTDALKKRLTVSSFALEGDEPLKLTLSARPRGCTGTELAQQLYQNNIIPEFYDPDFVTCMLTPENTDAELLALERALKRLPQRPPLTTDRPAFRLPERVMPPREAFFSPKETVPVENSVGRICASAAVACPPAIPIAVCGERIDETAAALLRYYGIGRIAVVSGCHSEGAH